MAKYGKWATPGFSRGIWQELTPQRHGSLEREILKRSGEYSESLNQIVLIWADMSQAMASGIQEDRDYYGYVPSYYSNSLMGKQILLPIEATMLFGERLDGNSWLQIMPRLYVDREEDSYRWIQGHDTSRLAFLVSAGVGNPDDYMDMGGFVVERKLILTDYDRPIVPVATIGLKTNIEGPIIPLLDTLGREDHTLVEALGGNNLQLLLLSSNTFLASERLPELYV